MFRHATVCIALIFSTSILAMGQKPKLEVTKIRDLTFTNAIQGSPTQTVELNSPSAAKFQITGKPRQWVTVTTPSEMAMSHSSTQESLIVEGIYVNSQEIQLDSKGKAAFSLGATLQSISVHATPGVYEGSATIQVSAENTITAININAQTQVVSALTTTTVRNLDFGSATITNGGNLVIEPSSSQSAWVTVHGNPNQVVSITLPSDDVFMMRTGNYLNNSIDEIRVRGFFSDANEIILDANGTGQIKIGATRDPLLQNQSSGDYVGTTLVCAIYRQPAIKSPQRSCSTFQLTQNVK